MNRSVKNLLGLLFLAALLGLAAAMASPFPLKMLLTQPGKVYDFVTADPPQHLAIVPVQGVASRQLVDTWGGARSGGRKHEGIDIFGPRNTPVLSATDGLVVSLSPNSLGGTVVWVLGPGRERHYYAHLESHAPSLAVGQWVEAGTVLGFVGDSGNARGTPPHLHYGIYRLGEGAVNPYERLKKSP